MKQLSAPASLRPPCPASRSSANGDGSASRRWRTCSRGTWPANASAPAPEAGHEVKLINFGQQPGDADEDANGRSKPLVLNFKRFAHNNTFEQAFVSGIAGFNRPTNVRFGPDGCAYIADYGAVRDFGRSDPDAGFKNGADAALVQIPGTGVIWKICPK